MKFTLEIEVITSPRDHNKWQAKITKRVETDIVGIWEREYHRILGKTWVASDFLEYIGTNIYFDDTFTKKHDYFFEENDCQPDAPYGEFAYQENE